MHRHKVVMERAKEGVSEILINNTRYIHCEQPKVFSTQLFTYTGIKVGVHDGRIKLALDIDQTVEHKVLLIYRQ